MKSSVMLGFLENPSPKEKTWTERLQEHIDNPRKEITKFRRWKIKRIQGLSQEYIYKTGIADGLDIVGTVEKPEVVIDRLPVSLLFHQPTQTRVVWQRTDNDQATILMVDRPKYKQGNAYALLPPLEKALDIIFNQQGYKSIYARAGSPIKDVGCRNKDWRSDLVAWRTRTGSVRPVLIPKLQAFWLRMCKYCVPAKCFGADYDDTGIIIFSPNDLKNLDKEALQELDNIHGDAKRKWKFTDLIK